MSKPHRFFNMYLTATMSVALVLFIIGLECVLLLSTESIIHRIKENLTVTLVLSPEADSCTVAAQLAAAPYIHEAVYVSADDALREHIDYLGEDPTKFLGYNPLRAAYEVHLVAGYTNKDSIQSIATYWKDVQGVERVYYPQEVLSVINQNINDLSIFLLVIAAILLLIALALIINTIRLQIYSKRFLINTMTLVGATPWVIKTPIVVRNLWIGIGASMMACVGLAAILYFIHLRMGIVLFELTWQHIGMIVGAVFVIGVTITTLASIMVANQRYQ